MINYIIGALIALLCGREAFNYFKKKHLADTLNTALQELDKEKVRNAKTKVEISSNNYDSILAAYNESRNQPSK